MSDQNFDEALREIMLDYGLGGYTKLEGFIIEAHEAALKPATAPPDQPESFETFEPLVYIEQAPSQKDEFGVTIDTTYVVRVDEGRRIVMAGLSKDLDKITETLQQDAKRRQLVESLEVDVEMLSRALDAARGEVQRLSERTEHLTVEQAAFYLEHLAGWMVEMNEPDKAQGCAAMAARLRVAARMSLTPAEKVRDGLEDLGWQVDDDQGDDWIPLCEVCSEPMEWEVCADCEGHGGEVVSFEPYEIEYCESCHGGGGGYACQNGPGHTDAEPGWGPNDIKLELVKSSALKGLEWRLEWWMRFRAKPWVYWTFAICFDCNRPMWGPWADKHNACVPF